MSALDARLIRESLAAVSAYGDQFTAYFYAVLFVENPDVRGIPLTMDMQRDGLVPALLTISQHIDRPEMLVTYLEQLAVDHRSFDVKPEHVDAVGRALIAALARFAGNAWTPEVQQSWVRAYSFLARTMIQAGERAVGMPAWWAARRKIADHRRWVDSRYELGGVIGAPGSNSPASIVESDPISPRVSSRPLGRAHGPDQFNPTQDRRAFERANGEPARLG